MTLEQESMKKSRLVTFLLAVVLIFSLYACAGEKSTIQADENTFLVHFCLDCEAEIFSIHFEYYLDGKPAGGGLVGNADGSALKYGEMLTKEFISADFPEDGDLSKFQIEIFALDGQGKEHPCNEILSFAVAYGNEYDITIGGGYDTGFTAKNAIRGKAQ